MERQTEEGPSQVGTLEVPGVHKMHLHLDSCAPKLEELNWVYLTVWNENGYFFNKKNPKKKENPQKKSILREKRELAFC